MFIRGARLGVGRTVIALFLLTATLSSCAQRPVEKTTMATVLQTTSNLLLISDAAPDYARMGSYFASCRSQDSPEYMVKFHGCADAMTYLVPLGYNESGEVLAWAHCPDGPRSPEECADWMASAIQTPATVRWRYSPGEMSEIVWRRAVHAQPVPTALGAPVVLFEGM
jgi:hypothetical protein